MKYTYYPGCSLEATSFPYDVSIRKVSPIIDIELEELEDWNCCGATAYMSVSQGSAFALSARNLALAEKKGWDIIAPCSACYLGLYKTNYYLRNNREIKKFVDKSLAEIDLEYNCTVDVRHYLDVVVNDVGFDVMRENVKRDLGGLKVASYYGCQTVRPYGAFDDIENPHLLDDLVSSLGADAIEIPMKVRCCGGSIAATVREQALRMCKNILDSVEKAGAEIVVTTCPMCHINLEAYQGAINRKFNTDFDIPILFFPQLMGFAFGLNEKELALDKFLVSPKKQLSAYV
jgi:heterodisulfide reductase subunit B